MPEHTLVEQLDQVIRSLLAGEDPPPGGDPELVALTAIASTLRDLPSEDFRQRLKTELQRRISMTASASTPAGARAGFRTITPFIIHARAPELVDFLKTTFGGEELRRKTGDDAYGFYSEVRIADSVLMIGGGAAASRGNLPSALHVYVDDCDAAYHRAIAAGAVPLTFGSDTGQPADRPYGERSGHVKDPFGNYWYIATRLGPAPAIEGLGSVLPYLHPQGARQYIEFLKQAFGAEEMAVYEQGGRVVHGAVRIGNAVVEMGEPDDRTGIPTNGFFLFVEDVEAAYARALAAGATAIRPPGDIPPQLRSAIVRDPAGYFWWPARWLA